MRFRRIAVLVLGLLAAFWPESLSGVVLVAGATTTTDDMDEAMKIIFDDSIVNSVVTDTELNDIFEEGGGIRMDQTTGGRYIETANMFQLPAGVGAREEGDYIPVPSGPQIVNGRVYLKKVMGAVEMTSETMKQVRSNIGAFLDWGERAMPSLVERVTHELDRMLLGYGYAIKARVNDATPATNLNVDSPLGVTWQNEQTNDALVQFLEGETLIASPNADGSTPRNSGETMTVDQVDFDNGYIVVDSLITGLADDDYLFPGDSAGNSAGKEPMGLTGIVDDGDILTTFQNINRTNYAKWRSYVMDVGDTFASGQTLTEDVIARADDEAFIRGKAKVDTLVTSRLGVRQLWADLKLDRSINDPRSFTAGRQGGINIFLVDRMMNIRVARKMPSTLLFGITKSTLRKWFLHRWEWDDTTGSIWRQVTDSNGRKDAFYAYGSLYCQYGGTDPQKNFRIEGWATS